MSSVSEEDDEFEPWNEPWFPWALLVGGVFIITIGVEELVGQAWATLWFGSVTLITALAVFASRLKPK